MRVAADLERAAGARVCGEGLRQALKPFRPGQGVVAQETDGTASLLEASPGEQVGTFDRLSQLVIDMALCCQQSGTLQLDDEPRERVSEHVVHLTRQPLSLGRDGRLGQRLSALLELEH